ncbi:MAG TPA: PqqD family protein [Candidatus Thalassarchaeaceae archaeon]|nr:PqqD family protein [Candidatus Thalassarchaeaceae archaeon]
MVEVDSRNWCLFNAGACDMDMADYLGGNMGNIDVDDGGSESTLSGAYPVRAPVWWGRRGEAFLQTELPGVSGRFVVLIHSKSFRRVEKLLAKILRAPRELRRPLDDMNSLLWELCDGHRTFEEIVVLMDEMFDEKVAPANERTESALRQLGERGFILFSRTEFEDAWPTGPGIDPEGVIQPKEGINSEPIDGDVV